MCDCLVILISRNFLYVTFLEGEIFFLGSTSYIYLFVCFIICLVAFGAVMMSWSDHGFHFTSSLQYFSWFSSAQDVTIDFILHIYRRGSGLETKRIPSWIDPIWFVRWRQLWASFSILLIHRTVLYGTVVSCIVFFRVTEDLWVVEIYLWNCCGAL